VVANRSRLVRRNALVQHLGVLSEFRCSFPTLLPETLTQKLSLQVVSFSGLGLVPRQHPSQATAVETFAPRSHFGNQRRRRYPVATYYPRPRCSLTSRVAGPKPRSPPLVVSSQAGWASSCRPRPASGSPTPDTMPERASPFVLRDHVAPGAENPHLVVRHRFLPAANRAATRRNPPLPCAAPVTRWSGVG